MVNIYLVAASFGLVPKMLWLAPPVAGILCLCVYGFFTVSVRLFDPFARRRRRGTCAAADLDPPPISAHAAQADGVSWLEAADMSAGHVFRTDIFVKDIEAACAVLQENVSPPPGAS